MTIQSDNKSYWGAIGCPKKFLVSFLLPKEEAARETAAKQQGEENYKPGMAHHQKAPPERLFTVSLFPYYRKNILSRVDVILWEIAANSFRKNIVPPADKIYSEEFYKTTQSPGW